MTSKVHDFDPAQAPQAVAEAQNHYIPKPYTIEKITRHTAMEWAFRVPVDFEGGFDKFVEVSLPLVGECPISISDFGEGWVELVIRNVGKVTSKLFELREGDIIFLRGSMGNGFLVKEEYIGKNLTVIAGGIGVVYI